MKKILLFVFSILLLSSCRVPESMMALYDENPFILTQDRIVYLDNPTFVFFTDAHIGRERNRGDVKRYDDNFFSFIEEGNYEVVVSGGDMADDGEVSDNLEAFLKRMEDSTTLYLETKGNHDRHSFNYKAEDLISYWRNALFGADTHVSYADLLENEYGVSSTGRYLIKTDSGDISIYILDTSTRSFSSIQLSWLEEALLEDETKCKIIVSHDNIITGGVADQSLFLTGMGDEEEIASFLNICRKGRVSLVLTGHHHKGNILYGNGKKYTEFNGACYHGNDSAFESRGWWYTISLSLVDESIYIDGYDASTKEKKKSWKINTKL